MARVENATFHTHYNPDNTVASITVNYWPDLIEITNELIDNIDSALGILTVDSDHAHFRVANGFAHYRITERLHDCVRCALASAALKWIDPLNPPPEGGEVQSLQPRS